MYCMSRQNIFYTDISKSFVMYFLATSTLRTNVMIMKCRKPKNISVRLSILLNAILIIERHDIFFYLLTQNFPLADIPHTKIFS